MVPNIWFFNGIILHESLLHVYMFDRPFRGSLEWNYFGNYRNLKSWIPSRIPRDNLVPVQHPVSGQTIYGIPSWSRNRDKKLLPWMAAQKVLLESFARYRHRSMCFCDFNTEPKDGRYYYIVKKKEIQETLPNTAGWSYYRASVRCFSCF